MLSQASRAPPACAASAAAAMSITSSVGFIGVSISASAAPFAAVASACMSVAG